MDAVLAQALKSLPRRTREQTGPAEARAGSALGAANEAARSAVVPPAEHSEGFSTFGAEARRLVSHPDNAGRTKHSHVFQGSFLRQCFFRGVAARRSFFLNVHKAFLVGQASFGG